MRLIWALGGIALIAIAGGCTSPAEKSGSGPAWNSPSSAAPAPDADPAPAASAPPWTEPAAYGFVLTRGCDDVKPLGRYRVTVSGGAVTKSERIDATAAEPSSSADVDLGPVVAGDDEEEIEVPTLRELAEMAQTAADDGGQVSTSFDAKDGHPVKATINVADDGAASATECFTVSEYAPAS